MSGYEPGEEIVVIVDEDNRVIGQTRRRIMRSQRLIHRASYILVFNGRGELLIQRRTLGKDIYPGHWDVAAGGVVLAGETPHQSAQRELQEELGIRARLRYLFDHYYEDADNRVWGSVFTCQHDGPFVLQEEEVDAVRFLVPAEVLAMSQQAPFTPDGLQILEKMLRERSGTPHRCTVATERIEGP